MSLAIEVDHVSGVLLSDGWHDVVEKSFTIDAYEYIHREEPGTMLQPHEILVAGGKVAGVSSSGAVWTEAGGSLVACPLSAILAVKYKPAPRKKKKEERTGKDHQAIETADCLQK